MKRLERKYIKTKGRLVVKEEIRQRIIPKTAKVNNGRLQQFRQKRIYKVNPRKLFREINGNDNEHKTEYTKNVEEELKREQQADGTIFADALKKCIAMMMAKGTAR